MRYTAVVLCPTPGCEGAVSATVRVGRDSYEIEDREATCDCMDQPTPIGLDRYLTAVDSRIADTVWERDRARKERW